MYKYVKISLLFLISFMLDRWTKYLVLQGVLESCMINNWLNVCVAYNRGIAWGIGSDSFFNNGFVLPVIIFCVLAYFTWYMYQCIHDTMLITACALILSGGVSNLCDRISYGRVIDFIQLHYGDWYFPVFNVADVSITVGALLLCMHIIWSPKACKL